nr:hypothetical protein [Mucilaginibacter sp. E4BP6]NYE68024.1 hypothetical protein [Mucilaginibacter sp. E4BP6]
MTRNLEHYQPRYCPGVFHNLFNNGQPYTGAFVSINIIRMAKEVKYLFPIVEFNPDSVVGDFIAHLVLYEFTAYYDFWRGCFSRVFDRVS